VCPMGSGMIFNSCGMASNFLAHLEGKTSQSETVIK